MTNPRECLHCGKRGNTDFNGPARVSLREVTDAGTHRGGRIGARRIERGAKLGESDRTAGHNLTVAAVR